MTPTIRTATPYTIVAIEAACQHPRAARACLAQANARRASEKVQQAIKNSEGAPRHAHNRLARKAASRLTIQTPATAAYQ